MFKYLIFMHLCALFQCLCLLICSFNWLRASKFQSEERKEMHRHSWQLLHLTKRLMANLPDDTLLEGKEKLNGIDDLPTFDNSVRDPLNRWKRSSSSL